MRNPRIFLLTGFIFAISACNMSSLKRTGYETLQNIPEEQCRKDLSWNAQSEKAMKLIEERVRGIVFSSEKWKGLGSIQKVRFCCI